MLGGLLCWVLCAVLCCRTEKCPSVITVRVVAQGDKGIEIKVRQPEKMSITVIALKMHQGSGNQLISNRRGSDSKFFSAIHYAKWDEQRCDSMLKHRYL